MTTHLAFTCSKLTIETIETPQKLTIKTLERRHWGRYGVFIINFEPGGFIVNFEHVIASWKILQNAYFL